MITNIIFLSVCGNNVRYLTEIKNEDRFGNDLTQVNEHCCTIAAFAKALAIGNLFSDHFELLYRRNGCNIQDWENCIEKGIFKDDYRLANVGVFPFYAYFYNACIDICKEKKIDYSQVITSLWGNNNKINENYSKMLQKAFSLTINNFVKENEKMILDNTVKAKTFIFG